MKKLAFLPILFLVGNAMAAATLWRSPFILLSTSDTWTATQNFSTITVKDLTVTSTFTLSGTTLCVNDNVCYVFPSSAPFGVGAHWIITANVGKFYYVSFGGDGGGAGGGSVIGFRSVFSTNVVTNAAADTPHPLLISTNSLMEGTTLYVSSATIQTEASFYGPVIFSSGVLMGGATMPYPAVLQVGYGNAPTSSAFNTAIFRAARKPSNGIARLIVLDEPTSNGRDSGEVQLYSQVGLGYVGTRNNTLFSLGTNDSSSMEISTHSYISIGVNAIGAAFRGVIIQGQETGQGKNSRPTAYLDVWGGSVAIRGDFAGLSVGDFNRGQAMLSISSPSVPNNDVFRASSGTILSQVRGSSTTVFNPFTSASTFTVTQATVIINSVGMIFQSTIPGGTTEDDVLHRIRGTSVTYWGGDNAGSGSSGGGSSALYAVPGGVVISSLTFPLSDFKFFHDGVTGATFTWRGTTGTITGATVYRSSVTLSTTLVTAPFMIEGGSLTVRNPYAVDFGTHMIIEQGTGRFGIGTQSPQVPFHLYSTTHTGDIAIFQNESTDPHDNIGIRFTITGGADIGRMLYTLHNFDRHLLMQVADENNGLRDVMSLWVNGEIPKVGIGLSTNPISALDVGGGSITVNGGMSGIAVSTVSTIMRLEFLDGSAQTTAAGSLNLTTTNVKLDAIAVDTTTLKSMISSTWTAFTNFSSTAQAVGISTRNIQSFYAGFTSTSDAQQTKFVNFRSTTDAVITTTGNAVGALVISTTNIQNFFAGFTSTSDARGNTFQNFGSTRDAAINSTGTAVYQYAVFNATNTNLIHSTNTFDAAQLYKSSVTFSSSTINIGGSIVMIWQSSFTLGTAGQDCLYRDRVSSQTFWGTCPTGGAAGGGGGAASLAVGVGSLVDFTQVSSPTTHINFSTGPFKASLISPTTVYIDIDYSSLTAQGKITGGGATTKYVWYQYPATSLLAGGTDFASVASTTGKRGLWPHYEASFNDYVTGILSTEAVIGSLILPPEIDASSSVVFSAYIRAETPAASKNIQLLFKSSATIGGAINNFSLETSTGADLVPVPSVAGEWTRVTWEDTVSHLDWNAWEMVHWRLERSHNTARLTTTELAGDLRMSNFIIGIPVKN